MSIVRVFLNSFIGEPVKWHSWQNDNMGNTVYRSWEKKCWNKIAKLLLLELRFSNGQKNILIIFLHFTRLWSVLFQIITGQAKLHLFALWETGDHQASLFKIALASWKLALHSSLSYIRDWDNHFWARFKQKKPIEGRKKGKVLWENLRGTERRELICFHGTGT